MIIPERLALVSTLALGKSSHAATDTPTDGSLCVMEAVAYAAGEPWSDSPSCACPVIAAFLRAWNDGLPSDADRLRLLSPMIPRLVGTKSTPAVEDRRAYLALDWLIRVYTPTWLDTVPALATHAVALRALPEIVDMATAHAANDAVRAAGAAARAAAAGAAARAAAARAAAWDRAGDACWDAAAWAAAARAAAGAAAARDAAWAAAGDASGAAAWDRAGDAWWDAAGDAAAWDALAPTVAILQESAVDLVGRMIAVTE